MAKKKKTLQEKLACRKYKQPNKFLWWLFNRFIVGCILEKKYNVTYEKIDDINKEDSACFLLYNHQSRCDYVWLGHLTYPRRMNFVVGYNEFFRSHLQLPARLLYFIPKKNFNTDVASLRAMNTIIKDKGVICMAPEGMSSIVGHNQPVALGTGKLIKHYDIPVYICKSKGGYLMNHKVCLDFRKGRIDSKIFKLLTPEQIKELTPEQIEFKLNEALWQDDYKWNKKERIKWKTHGNICSHLHDICYRCPRCGKEFDMIGEKNFLKCNSCGNGATMNDYYDFIPFDDKCVIPESPSIWVDEERKLVYQEIQDPNFEFVENVKLGKLPEYHYVKHHKTSEICGQGQIRINHEGFFYKGTKDGKPFEFKLEYKNLPTTGMVTTVEFFAVYHEGKFYDMFPERPCVEKVVLIVEEMHRLHVNAWKNFPWADTYGTPEMEIPNKY